ncbi:hypothetical protein B0T26DRAFT_680959 [Lasiosphaeria miniovina]|uniref:DUF6594 domain-containing protein n=1 Tax=Lasiosphaeria miniovina TaxID=1954250 RepID=A0AA39ZTB7_9PEZI|nr:uncharacterized protein B0T26DRAFT_680959 [Lasiosphaeria miniovina]KAK0703255.1 hypothetical protein B0T26DRAFT_680959 [Lasiosphaeria miniovina]
MLHRLPPKETLSQVEAFPPGYPSLAAFLGNDRDFAMFRSFRRLHARVLLRKQDELAQLQQRLDGLDDAENKPSPYSLTTNRRQDAKAAEQAALLSELINSLLTSFLKNLKRPEPEGDHVKSVANWMDGKKPLARAEFLVM